ncbi:acyl-CoA desaturase [Vibrio fluvialis]|uniref:acyl-CoA desaturase n=1 Tax=Vibrio fluvialis TaxID=676 RepID=UPI001404731A|nr:fatty acid desaturase [Vibrio fluvialis]EKO3977166.1 fatty acid desaturase [Vibrio fluvialis]MBY8245563.1 fatty acid desaturase [Vibrio fluvialis]NHN73503.1 acyl-CoA desaturase [Vibrio fluvialis]
MANKPPLIWLNITIFAVSFVLAAVVAPWYGWQFGYGWEHLIWLIVCFSFCNLSITTGYHRLWSHKAFEAHWLVRLLCALGGAFAVQNSALHWASDHRVHHKFVDQNDKDPYSAKRGFWFSHIGWMLRNYNSVTYDDYSNCRDLHKDKIVMWQHRFYVPLALIMNFGVPIALGWYYNDIWGMLLLVGAVRLVLNHHTTFFINSLAHIWGKQPYTNKNTARDNGILAFFTFGEGYHNYHHIFENDYRNGIYWWQYDPTKWLIKSCAWLGLAKKLRTAPAIKIEKARAEMSLKYAAERVAHLPNHLVILANVQAEFDAFIHELHNYYDVKKQLLESKKNSALKRYEHSVLKARYQSVKSEFLEKRQRWQQTIAQYA